MTRSFDWAPSCILLQRPFDIGSGEAAASDTARSGDKRPTPPHASTRTDAALANLAALRTLVMEGASISVGARGVSALSASNDTRVPYLHCETSGTSGRSKIIKRTQSSWRQSFEVNGKVLGLSHRDRVAVFGDLGSSLVLYGALEAAHHGAGLLTLCAMRPDRQRETLAQHAATVLYLTPTQLGQICTDTPRPLPAVRAILVGGGPLGADVRRRAANAFPNAKLIHFYGAAETSFIAWSDATTPLGAVGRAYPQVVLSIRSDSGEEVDDIGEIWVQSPYLFEGYVAGESVDTRWDGAFLSVGEYGRLDADGNLFVAGRKSRMVTIADVNVFPEEVETYLAQQVQADAIAVVAEPDSKRGHRLVALIAGADGDVSVDALLSKCRRDLGPLHAPRRVAFTAQMPVLPAGKPDYAAIRTLLEGTA